MRIVDRKTFLALPAGVLFSKYEPCVFEDLCIKGDSLPNDWYEQQIADAIDCPGASGFSDQLLAAEETGASVGMDFECEGRDGLYDLDQLFAVWEAEDIARLMARLARVVPAQLPTPPQRVDRGS